ncbi:peptidyl-prolyl cis-trans isomerase CYP21-4-like [Wolffia australiana]
MGKIKPQALLQQSKKKKGPARISVSAVISCNLMLILIALSLYAAYKYWYSRSQFQTDTSEVNKNFVTIGGRRSMKFELPTLVILNTTAGSISLELFKAAKPRVVDRFLNLCEDGHFEGSSFYHVMNNGVIKVCKDQKLGSAKYWPLKVSGTPIGTRSTLVAHMLATTKASLEDDQDFDIFMSPRRNSYFSDKFIVFGRVRSENVIQKVQSMEDHAKQTKVSIESCMVESTASV